MIYICFLYEWNRIKKFHSFSNFDKNRIPGPQQQCSNWLILKFVFIHFETVRVSQNEEIRMWIWYLHVFFINGTELRSFSHFQILTKIRYPDLKRNLQIDKFWSLASFTVKLWKSVKMINFECKYEFLLFPCWKEQN